MSLREELTTKYGPLPGWAWLLGFCGLCTFGLVVFTIGAVAVADRLKPTAATAGPDQAAHAIRIVEPTSGRWKHTEKTDTNTIVTIAGREDRDRRAERVEFVETVLEPTPAASRRLTRAYQVASDTVNGTTTHRPYAGKTVAIEKAGDLWTFKVGGRDLTPAEAETISREFTGGRGLSWSDRVPGRPVSVGEQWEVGKDVLRTFARGRAVDLDVEQSSIKGRLVRVYSEGGRQWGQLEFKGTMTLGKTAAQDGPPTLHQTLTLESPIDGRAGELRTNQRVTAAWEAKFGGMTGPATAEIITDRSVTPVD